MIEAAVDAIHKIGPAGWEIVLRQATNTNVRRFAYLIDWHGRNDESWYVLSPAAARILLAYAQGDAVEMQTFAVDVMKGAIHRDSPSKETVVAVLRAEKDTTRLVRVLIEMLEDEKKFSYGVLRVAKTLGSRAKDVAPTLVKARLRERSAISEDEFKSIGVTTKDLLPNIVEGLRDAKAEVRTTAAQWLAEMGSAAKPALPDLLQALQDVPKRKKEADHEGMVSGPGASSWNREAEDETAWLAELDAVQQLGVEPRKLIPLLARVVADRGSAMHCRMAATTSLQKFAADAKAAGPSLLKVFVPEEEYYYLRLAALVTLRKIGIDSRQVVPELIKFLEDEMDRRPDSTECSSSLARATWEYLIALHPQPKDALLLLLEAFQQYKNDTELRTQLAGALGQMGPVAGDALPALCEAAKAPDAALRKAAEAAIAKIDVKEPK